MSTGLANKMANRHRVRIFRPIQGNTPSVPLDLEFHIVTNSVADLIRLRSFAHVQ